MGRLSGKVAVITGATSGIGLRTAEIFVAEGARIVIAGRRAPEGEALAAKLGPNCVFRRTDVTAEDQVQALIGQAVETFGRIDCLFNNAGGPTEGGLEDVTGEQFHYAIPHAAVQGERMNQGQFRRPVWGAMNRVGNLATVGDGKRAVLRCH